ncbi:SDR family oxidoreductase [Anaerovibrio lipolyticus]|uniref:SDR family NAD(P)-dependent oxidoreductase n=1 Tax=Anaerovibrio lipolyticus TaxID=82374 RepID=UPI0023F4334E|nr:SDR family oxidoreductase [Anaerovibrio lipolyticus]
MKEVVFDFNGKNFVVVGASSGMGYQVAVELAEAGAGVLAVARNKERLKELGDRYPERISIASVDVTRADGKEWTNVLDDFIAHRGKFNGLVYTAGTTGTTPLRFYDEAVARAIMETGFWGAIGLMQVLSKKKYVNPSSSFVLFASTAGHVGTKGLSVYSAAKGALMVAVRSLTHDLAKDRHRINTISPGYVNTGMTRSSIEEMGEPFGVKERHLLGIGEPSDVSGMVLFLLSDRAKWITGEDFVVDGGQLRGAWR